MNTDLLDTGLIFGAIAAFNHGGPVAGCAFSIAAASIAVMRRSSSLQAALLNEDEPRLLSAPARYFFKPAPPLELPAPKAPKRKRLTASTEEGSRTLVTPQFNNAPVTLPEGSERTETVEAVSDIGLDQKHSSEARSERRLPETQSIEVSARAELTADGITIEIGKLRNKQPLRVPIKHGIVSVATGGGKTNMLDYITIQLVELDRRGEIELWVASPKYVAVTKDRIERYRMFASIPQHRKEFRGEMIVDWIERAAETMQHNYDRANEPPYIWPDKPMILIFDEIKALLEISDAETEARIMKALKTILLKGREIECFIIFASQDGYCGSLKLTVGEIQNLGFRAIHPALDANSLKNLLPPGYRMPAISSFAPHEWLIATGNRVSIAKVPRVDNAMLRAYGLYHEENETSAMIQDNEASLKQMRRTSQMSHDTTRHETPRVQNDPFETWIEELMSVDISTETVEAHETKELMPIDTMTSSIKRAVAHGKLERSLILALAGGDETKAIIALAEAGLKPTPIAKVLGGRLQDTLTRVKSVLEVREIAEV